MSSINNKTTYQLLKICQEKYPPHDKAVKIKISRDLGFD